MADLTEAKLAHEMAEKTMTASKQVEAEGRRCSAFLADVLTRA